MAVLLALFSAVVYGVSDYAGGRASKVSPAVTVSLGAECATFVTLSVVVLVLGDPFPPWSDVLWGFAAGLATCTGVIALYYALTGIACAFYHRRQLTRSLSAFLLIGVGPVVGSLLLIWLLALSVSDLADPASSYSEQAWLGVGPPLVIGIGIFIVGLLIMFWWRTRDARYWQEKPSLAPEPAARE